MENRLFLMDKNVFSAEYLNWVCDLTAMVPPPKTLPNRTPSDTAASGGVTGAGGARQSHDGDDIDEVELSAAKVALFLALDTVARARDKERLSQLMQYARSWFRASPAVCRWALEQVGRVRVRIRKSRACLLTLRFVLRGIYQVKAFIPSSRAGQSGVCVASSLFFQVCCDTAAMCFVTAQVVWGCTSR